MEQRTHGCPLRRRVTRPHSVPQRRTGKQAWLVPAWQKSSYSAANDNCVEVRTADGVVELRESDDGEVIVRTAPAKFAEFLRAATAGEFDHHVN
ncbi:DUF397 domain-containing protein [Kitasatospora aureofaciens]|uniref:DUF397 domain-containing protein n=1 Tax=Kitasatospora aureofaciens TaxID=1894 RepID=UPI0033F2A527